MKSLLWVKGTSDCNNHFSLLAGLDETLFVPHSAVYTNNKPSLLPELLVDVLLNV